MCNQPTHFLRLAHGLPTVFPISTNSVTNRSNAYLSALMLAHRGQSSISPDSHRLINSANARVDTFRHPSLKDFK